MRTFIIAVVIASLVGILYQKVFKEDMDIKEVTDYAKNMVDGVTGQISNALGDEEAKQETIDNAINNVEEFSSNVSEKVREEATKKAQEIANNIISENMNTDKNIPCDKAIKAIEKILHDEELISKEDKYIDGLYKSMLNTSDISKEEAFNTIKLIYCGNN